MATLELVRNAGILPIHEAEAQLPQASYALITRYNEKNELQILVLRSKLTGKWALPGGKFDEEKDDDLEGTLIREVGEETGLEILDHQIDPIPLSITRTDDGFGNEQMASFYIVDGVKGEPRESLPDDEMTEHKWLNLRHCSQEKELEPAVLLLFMHARHHIPTHARRPISLAA